MPTRECRLQTTRSIPPSGDGVRVQNSSGNVTLKNNIVWTENGYDIYVATNSQTGFASDYNNLFTSGGGKVVWFQKDFTDLFDWQVEADFDVHSIGYTVPHPTLDNPQFVNLAANDFRLVAATSTSIDAGDPASAFVLEPGPNGNRINLGAYGNTILAATSRPAYLDLDYPNYYVDAEINGSVPIRWHGYNVSGNVDIDLYEQGVGKVADIALVPTADGQYVWSPPASVNPTNNLTKRFFIRITSVGTPTATDDSREPFSITNQADDYYINVRGDATFADNEYTTAAGDNRATGKSPGDPKANLLPMLRSYDLGSSDTVHIDTGTYVHVRNVVISGAGSLDDRSPGGNDEGATFTGPTDPVKIAKLDRANTNTGTTALELNDGDFVTLSHLTLSGAEKGLWVHNVSQYLTATYLTLTNNSQDGLLVASDATGTVLDSLIASSNGQDGLDVSAPIASLSHSTVFNNTSAGIRLTNVGAAVLENNEVYGNAVGIDVSNSGSGSPTVIGNANLALGKGNKVSGNSSTGINANYNVLVSGNTVYGQSGSGDVGINLDYGAQAIQNVVYSNYNGIVGGGSGNATINNNRVYNNSNIGILARYLTNASGNVVYSNSIGIQSAVGGYNNSYSFSGDLTNNLVYANTNQGIVLDHAQANGSDLPQVINNTVYREVGDAIRIQGSSPERAAAEQHPVGRCRL